MLGYIGHEQNVTWFAPGDLGYLDPKMNGYLRLVGRTKEQIVLRNTLKKLTTFVPYGLNLTINEKSFEALNSFVEIFQRQKEIRKSLMQPQLIWLFSSVEKLSKSLRLAIEMIVVMTMFIFL